MTRQEAYAAWLLSWLPTARPGTLRAAAHAVSVAAGGRIRPDEALSAWEAAWAAARTSPDRAAIAAHAVAVASRP